MLRFHMNVDSRCVMCNLEDETHEHLFCQCQYTRQIYGSWHWNITREWNKFKNGEVYSAWRLSSIEKELTFLYVAVAMFMIWKERNLRIHDHTSRGAASIIAEVKRFVREKIATCNFFKQSLQRDPELISHMY